MPNRAPIHRVQRAHGVRPDAAKRKIYNSRLWRDGICPRIKRRDPLCQIAVLCKGVDPTTEVDHVVPIERGGDESDDNLWGVCHADHSRKTAMEQRGTWVHPDPLATVKLATAPANLNLRKES